MKNPVSMLRAARERAGLTIRELHDATGIATGRLSMLERYMVDANVAERERLAAALEAEPAEVFPPAARVLTRTST